MEDLAVGGDEVCFAKLAENGGEEESMRYVSLNKEVVAKGAPGCPRQRVEDRSWDTD
jgi:hypothetical protein